MDSAVTVKKSTAALKRSAFLALISCRSSPTEVSTPEVSRPAAHTPLQMRAAGPRQERRLKKRGRSRAGSISSGDDHDSHPQPWFLMRRQAIEYMDQKLTALDVSP